ncbi:MAG: hypothetical protein JWR69_894, partial [Pedosphaera sp.]|nr:hypothetical protein [Pedosphaera sp.]
WGNSSNGRTNVPAGLSDAVVVAAGASHSMVLRANGTVIAWGDNTSGQTNVPTASSNLVAAIAAGGNHNLSLTICGEPLAMTAAATAVRSNSGTLNGMVFQDEPSALAWFEWGSTRSLGQVAGPVPVIATTNFVSRVSVGISGLTFGQTCFYRLAVSNVFGVAYGAVQQFTTGGKLLAWGYNTSGQTNIPPGLTNAVAIAGGLDHSLALRNDGRIISWGPNTFDHLTNVPVSLSNAVAIAGGTWHSAALRNDGKVIAWGDNNSGQTNVPTALTNVVAVACGQSHTLALKADGTVAVWGGNDQGQTNFPPGLRDIATVAAGQRHCVALKVDGTVVAWGNNDTGQTNAPASLNGVVAIAAGTSHSVALLSNGTVVTWGAIWSSTTKDLSNVVAIASGDDFILALKEDGSLAARGFNSYGVKNIPAGLGNVVTLGAGAIHSMAIGPNLPPVANAQTVAGFPNRDKTMTLAGSDPNGDLVNFRIVSLPAAGTLYQYVAGSRGAAVLAADTPVSDPGGRMIFAPLINDIGSPYGSFDFVANDGTADSAPAAITLSLVLPVAPQFAGADRSTDGSFQFSFTGDSNAAYRVWASTNLLDWDLLGIANMTSPGLFQLSDPSATNWPQRFYRAGAP